MALVDTTYRTVVSNTVYATAKYCYSPKYHMMTTSGICYLFSLTLYPLKKYAVYLASIYMEHAILHRRGESFVVIVTGTVSRS